MKTRPFNLEEAIAGSVCWNKDLTVFATYGFDIESEVCQSFHVFRAESTVSSFALFVDNAGLAYSSVPGERLPQYDLFMKKNQVEYWVATAACAPAGIISSYPKTTEELSIADIKNNCPAAIHDSIQTHKVTRYE